MLLSILCVTQAEPHAMRFLNSLCVLGKSMPFDAEVVIAADGDAAWQLLAFAGLEASVVRVRTRGYIESALDAALTYCTGKYVLRLDDDETCSLAMIKWLQERKFEAADHWKFPRMHLLSDTKLVAMTPHLFPDEQTRLSVHAKAGGRSTVHAGSPHGGGELAPVCIEHHKFLVRSVADRERIARMYDRQSPGYGTGGMLPFSLPEKAYAGQRVPVVGYWDGGMPVPPELPRMDLSWE